MSKKDDLTRCKSSIDILTVAPRVGKQKGIPVKRVNGGSHVCLEVRGRRIPVGHISSQPLPPGTLHAIMKSLAAVGLVGVLFMVVFRLMEAL